MLIAIIGFTFLIILIFFFISEINSSKKNTTQNNTHTNCDPLRPQNKVINAIRSIWSNDFFLFDFKNILIELSIDEKSINNLTVFKFRNTESIEYKHWQLINSEDFIYPEIIDEIINKILKSSSFCKIKNDYEFLDEDLKHFCKLLVMYMTLSDFFTISQKWIFKNINKPSYEVEPDICRSLFENNISY
jgi:hypothetical protein